MTLWPRGWPRRFGGRLWWNLLIVLACWSLPWTLDAVEATRIAVDRLGVDADAARVAAIQGVLLTAGTAIVTTILLHVGAELVLPRVRGRWTPRVLLVLLAVASAVVLPLLAGAATYGPLVLLLVHGAVAGLWGLPPVRAGGGGGSDGGGGPRMPRDPFDEDGPRGAPARPEDDRAPALSR